MEEKVPFTLVMREVNYLGINFIRNGQGLCEDVLGPGVGSPKITAGSPVRHTHSNQVGRSWKAIFLWLLALKAVVSLQQVLVFILKLSLDVREQWGLWQLPDGTLKSLGRVSRCPFSIPGNGCNPHPGMSSLSIGSSCRDLSLKLRIWSWS